MHKNLSHNSPTNTLPLVASDLEGTLTAGNAWRGMYGYLVAHGRGGEARRFLYKNLAGYLLHKIRRGDTREYHDQWMRNLLRLFRGYTCEQLQHLAEWVVERELWPQRRRKVVTELQEHLEQGRHVIVVTGAYEPFLESLLKRLPGMEAIGTPLVIENGVVTGEVATPFNVGKRKVEQLRPFMREAKIHTAYGDTAPDRYMLEISEHPVAVHPDKTLRRLAETKGWRILIGE